MSKSIGKTIKKEIIITGSGGQGIQLLGEILAEAAAKEGKEVSLNTSYGAEVKGGKSKTEIIISDEKIDFPGVLDTDIIMVLSRRGIDDLACILKENVMVFFDAIIPSEELKSKVKYPVLYYSCLASKIAADIGNIKTANMAILGYLIGATKIVSPDKVLNSIEGILIKEKKEKLIEINKKAFMKGFSAEGGNKAAS